MVNPVLTIGLKKLFQEGVFLVSSASTEDLNYSNLDTAFEEGTEWLHVSFGFQTYHSRTVEETWILYI